MTKTNTQPKAKQTTAKVRMNMGMNDMKNTVMMLRLMREELEQNEVDSHKMLEAEREVRTLCKKLETRWLKCQDSYQFYLKTDEAMTMYKVLDYMAGQTNDEDRIETIVKYTGVISAQLGYTPENQD